MARFRLTAIQLIAALGLLWGTTASALAQASREADDYKKNIENAVLEFDSGNWAEARVLFEQAHALRPSARTLRGMGKVSFELKQYVRAQRELNASLVELRSPLSVEQREEVLALLLRVERYIGKLVVHVKPVTAAASIMLDGSSIEGELKLEVGQHELDIHAPGYRTLTRSVSIEGGKTSRLELTLTPDSSGLQPGAAARAQPQSTELRHSPVQVSPPADGPRSGLLQQWWFWTIVGVAVAGGAATALALTLKPTAQPPVPGNTGLQVQVLTFSH